MVRNAGGKRINELEGSRQKINRASEDGVRVGKKNRWMKAGEENEGRRNSGGEGDGWHKQRKMGWLKARGWEGNGGERRRKREGGRSKTPLVKPWASRSSKHPLEAAAGGGAGGGRSLPL